MRGYATTSVVLLPALLLPLASGFPSQCQRAGQAEQEFDYVVVGGGTSGLVIANRLSEDADVTVAVIEAGDSQQQNPNVTDPQKYGTTLFSPIDWQYPCAAQIYTNNSTHTYFAGKALGGTSVLNGMLYVRTEDYQIDLWEEVGNAGLNWNSLLPYMNKAEGFIAPDEDRQAKGATFEAELHGTDGPIKTGWPSFIMGDGANDILKDTWANLGLPLNRDVNGGKLRGFNNWPATVNADTDTRSDAATEYLFPIQDQRKNLKVFVNTFANKLVWNEQDGEGGPSARGVDVTGADGVTSTIVARREVVVSLGTIRSPAFLEHSGVGNPSVLDGLSIPVKVNLPTVGENLQDQPNFRTQFKAKRNFTGIASHVSYVNVYDLFGTDAVPALQADVEGKLGEYAQMIADQARGSTTAEKQRQLLQTQFDLLFKKNITVAEFLFNQPTFLGAQVWPSIPFSRGSTHITTTNTTAFPYTNPNFFMFDWDVKQHVAIQKLMRRLLVTSPMNEELEHESWGGPALEASDEEWSNWIKGNYGPTNHPTGTVAMMSRELGGVVDSEHRVYGTSNVRVVDASVMPFQINGHVTATLYALAERAADLIKKP